MTDGTNKKALRQRWEELAFRMDEDEARFMFGEELECDYGVAAPDVPAFIDEIAAMTNLNTSGCPWETQEDYNSRIDLTDADMATEEDDMKTQMTMCSGPDCPGRWSKDTDYLCTVCGAEHSEACGICGQKGYHAATCATQTEDEVAQ